MVLRGETMEDVLLIVIMVASFAFVIGLIAVISQMLERDADRGELADEPPDTSTPDYGSPGNGVAGNTGWRP
jgi:hypothetical protein